MDMQVTLPKRVLDVKTALTEPLLKNSLFIMITSVATALFGFLFWLIAARLYTQQDVGIATAIISAMGLFVLISRLGFDQSMIRFFPKCDKDRALGTILIITTGFALITGTAFVATVGYWLPDLQVVTTIAPFFLLFLAANMMTVFIGTSFIAVRKGDYYFFQGLSFGSRLLFLFPLTILGSLGIFSSLGLSFVIALVLSFFLLFRFGIRWKGIDLGFVRDSFHFSTGGYFSLLFMTAPQLVLPLIVMSILGPAETAQYYIVYAIISILFFIPSSFAHSLFVEGSHGEELKKITLRALYGTYAIVIPVVVFLIVFGGFILGIIGPDYQGNIDLLRAMALSGIFLCICETYLSIRKIQGNVKSIVYFSFGLFALLLGLSTLFLLWFGLIGVGYAWIVSYFLGSIFVVFILMRQYFGTSFNRGGAVQEN